MVSAVKKQIDVVRLTADLAAAKVELLSAQCAAAFVCNIPPGTS